MSEEATSLDEVYRESEEYRCCEGCRESFASFLFPENSDRCYLCIPLDALERLIGDSL